MRNITNDLMENTRNWTVGETEKAAIAAALRITKRAEDGLMKNAADRREERIGSKGHLTADVTVRQTAISEIEREWSPRHLAPVESAIADVIARANAASRPQPTDPTARLTQLLDHQERRRGFSALDTEQRKICYLLADPNTRAAIESGPPILSTTPGGGPFWEPLVPPDIIEEQRLAEFAAAYPDQAARLRELQTIAGTLRHLRGLVTGSLMKAVPVALHAGDADSMVVK